MKWLPRPLIVLAVGLVLLAALAGTAILLGPRSGSDTSGGPAAQPTEATLPLKVITRQEGLTAISDDQLRAAGLDPAVVPLEQWQLHRDDSAVPLLPLPQDDGLQLVFYAEPSDTPYSAERVYWLEATADGGLRPRIQALAPASDGFGVVEGMLRLDWTDTYYSRLDGDGDRWLGPSLFAGRDLVLPFQLPDLAEGPARLRLGLYASTASPGVDPDHHVEVWVNGRQVGDGTHEGQGLWQIQADLPPGLLQRAENELRLVAPGDTGARVEQDFPDWLEIDYPQALVVGDQGLTFVVPPGSYQVTGLTASEDVLLWDVSNPADPVQLEFEDQPLAVGGEALGFQLAGEDGQPRRLVVAALNNLASPLAIARPNAQDLTALTPADYLAIGPQELLAALAPLLAWREQQGLAVQAVDVEAVYEQFDYGRRGPEAIRSFLRHLAATWPSPPSHVLLVGDSSYDPRGYGGAGQADLVPTCLVDTYFVGETASDHCYSDLDGDLSPELAVGRLPARSADQVETIVDKIIAYEQTPAESDWLQRALLVADAEPEFPQASDLIASEILGPASYDLQTLYLNDPALAQADAARTRLFDLLNTGVGLVSYIGHGSPRWWAGELLSAEDAADLNNQGRWPIFTAMTCLNGFFHHPTVESLSEALLWTEGGAVAAFMPSSEGITSEQLPIARSFYRHLTEGKLATLGEVVAASKRELVESGMANEDLIQTYNLLGDPALRLPYHSLRGG